MVGSGGMTTAASTFASSMPNNTLRNFTDVASTLTKGPTIHSGNFSATTLSSTVAKDLSSSTTESSTSHSVTTTIVNIISSTIPSSVVANDSTTPFNASTTENSVYDKSSSFFVTSILLPLLAVLVICTAAGIILLVIRKNKLEKLRHHLMPVYNFDPSEDGEDWETELLDENMTSPRGFGSLGSGGGMIPMGAGLKLDTGITGGLKIDPPTNSNRMPAPFSDQSKTTTTTSMLSGDPGSPTATSGLLRTSGNNISLANNNFRRLYTDERHQLV